MIAVGTFALMKLGEENFGNLSPFNIRDAVPTNDFSVEEIVRLFDTFTSEWHVTLEEGIAKNVYEHTLGFLLGLHCSY